MRAVFLEQEIKGQQLLIEGDSAFHLIKVLRIEVGEKLQLLNGEGLMVHAQVKAVHKKDLEIEILNQEIKDRLSELSLAIGIVKKEALEEILKASVELGIKNLYLVRTQFSQVLPEWNDRSQKLLISALLQSNNPYLPKVSLVKDLKEIPFQDYSSLITFSTLAQERKKEAVNFNKGLFLIGPEGGFSAEEEAFLMQKGSHIINLPLPIMRAKTAVIFACGYILGKSLN